MSDYKHRSKYQIHFILASILLLSFTGLIFVSIFQTRQLVPEYVLAISAGLLLCGSAYFISSATVHKVKSDLSRKTRRKESKKDTTSDE